MPLDLTYYLLYSDPKIRNVVCLGGLYKLQSCDILSP